MCLKYLPNTTRGIKPMIIYLINEMEMKNAAYAADLFAIEKNGLNQAFRIEISDFSIWFINYGP